MYNTLHVFGDSFSAGVGVDIHQGILPTVPKGYRKYTNTTFYNNIPCNEVVNYAKPGISNEFILLTLIKAMPNIKPGDLVVLGLTEWARVTVPIAKSREKNLNLNLTGGYYLEHLQVKRLDHIEHLKLESGLTVEEVDTAFKFYELLTFPQHRSDIKRDYYLEAVKPYGSFLTDMGVKFVMWDYTLWGRYEILTTWSKGVYEDGHWSPNGHRSFLGYLLWGLQNNVTYLNRSHYKSNRVKVLKYAADLGLDGYINPPDGSIVI